MRDYRVAFLADSHLFDWDGMFSMTSEERLSFGVRALLHEASVGGKLDAVLMPGDFCNNAMLPDYPAGVFRGLPYASGSSGSDHDPQGEVRLSVFKQLISPLTEAGIPVYALNGNHDICSHRSFEKVFSYTSSPFFLRGSREDPAHPLGYGKNYAVAINEEAAFICFDVFDGEEHGFTVNASGKNWAETPVPTDVVKKLFDATEQYQDVFVAAHWLRPELQAPILAEIERRSNVKAAFVGHTHMETVTAYPFGKPELVCGYLGVPMYERQKDFMKEPFSYRILERKGRVLESYIVLMEHEYPAYCFERSSKASIPAFYQPYFRRPAAVIEE